ncbi:phage holin family protein [Methylophilus glucosoxydans]|uniref:Phage holin family protein n=1 Tax=Methylophilus glucosoxydans TaxID=752553 RepID=A0ABW3GQ47_9PROT
MWLNLLKFVAVLFLDRKVSALKDNFINLRHHVADYTEDRAQHMKQDFLEETQRMATSIVGLLVVFSMFIFTGLLGLMWLFSILWENPHRTLILGLVMLIPAAIGLIVFLAVRAQWYKKPLFADSLSMISHDWQVFRNEIAPPPPATPEDEGGEAAHTEKPASDTPKQ